LGVSPDQCLVIEDSAGGIKAAVAAGMTAVGLCAASHIREGHDLKLRDAGAVHLAYSWPEVERFALQFFKCQVAVSQSNGLETFMKTPPR
jgi:beta-phosphoglucomutase-like phosphatase (HAD superfamily)